MSQFDQSTLAGYHPEGSSNPFVFEALLRRFESYMAAQSTAIIAGRSHVAANELMFCDYSHPFAGRVLRVACDMSDAGQLYIECFTVLSYQVMLNRAWSCPEGSIMRWLRDVRPVGLAMLGMVPPRGD